MFQKDERCSKWEVFGGGASKIVFLNCSMVGMTMPPILGGRKEDFDV